MHIIAIDQEQKGLAVITDGIRTQISDFHSFTPPIGGGIIVADTNVWAVNNGLSQSQYCFSDLDDRKKFLSEMSDKGYKCISVSTKYARIQYLKHGMSQADAVQALYDEIVEQIEENGQFSSGKPVRESRGDVSFGMRDLVVKDFLRMQNAGGYESDFMNNAIEIAWNALDNEGKKLFNLKIRTPKCDSPNRISAVLVCTHDPLTGERREYNGKPWGKGFIVDRILCLNGMMQGTGSLSPGSPMRAVLRILGRRWGDKINKQERTAMDKNVKVLIDAFQKHEVI